MNEPNELDRYLELRQIGMRLNAALLHRLPKKALKESALDLGMWHEDTLFLRSESDLAILCDYTLYNYYKNDHNAIQNHLAQATAEMNPDVRLMLEAEAQSRYTIVQVNNIVSNLGVNVQDLLYHDSFFLTDQAMGNSSYPGIVFATRIITLPTLIMTSGAPMPLLGPALQSVFAYLNQYVYPRQVAQLTAEEKSRLQAIIIILALGKGTSA